MYAKTFDKLGAELNHARARFQEMQSHFERFCAEAERFNEPQSPVKGVNVKREGQMLFVACLDRRIRISMRFDHKAAKGALHVEDLSATERPMKTIPRIPFDESGQTDLGRGEEPGKLTLASVPDCKRLALHCIELALDQDPWAS
jgi:hypothetical protein